MNHTRVHAGTTPSKGYKQIEFEALELSNSLIPTGRVSVVIFRVARNVVLIRISGRVVFWMWQLNVVLTSGTLVVCTNTTVIGWSVIIVIWPQPALTVDAGL